MKTALVCIAKNEDYYIEEWLYYHLKLGFDDIYVYQNNWRYNGVKSQFPSVHWLVLDGDRKQLHAYNSFISKHFDEYSWAAFFDVDEFLVIRHCSLKEYLQSMDNHYGIGVNWRLFGSSGLKFIGDYHVISRFKTCGKEMNEHVKTMLHLQKLKQYRSTLQFQDPHSVNWSMKCDMIATSDGSLPVHGPFNYRYFDKNVQLNHYFSKTLEEYICKVARGRACSFEKLSLDYFHVHDLNDVIDTAAYDFMMSC